MHTSRGMEGSENISSRTPRSEGFYCVLPPSELEAFQRIRLPVEYPSGATLFMEGEQCQGIYILCSGRVKLFTTSRTGQTLILQIARPGDVLGLGATVSATTHDSSAEAGQLCRLNFIRGADFLHFLQGSAEARMHAALHLGNDCQHAYRQFRSLMGTAPERIAHLILDWSLEESGNAPEQEINISLTHEEIAQIVGTSRETVTRTLADFRRRRIAKFHGSMFVVQDLLALRQIASPDQA
jgi:CRP/FNR family transcriptional regulator, cyclic AMP receptor protein